jgi:hypothetical protein
LFLITLLPGPAAQAAEAGVEFSIAYSGGRYIIAMRPTVTPAHPGLTLAAQVTIKAPHGVGRERFMVSNVQSQIAGTLWTARSRVDAPKEDTTADYISFELSFPTQNYAAIRWQAGQEVKLFSFANSAKCLGWVRLLENSDPFMPPNSLGTNPGNQIDLLGLGEGNRYLGTYARGQADCRSADGVEHTAVVLAQRAVLRTGDQVAVVWSTASESAVLGFHLYRQSGNQVVQLNDTLIVAQASGTTQGASYRQFDHPADPDAYALYLLDVVDLDGQSQRLLLGAVNAHPLFLPFVLTASHAKYGRQSYHHERIML